MTSLTISRTMIGKKLRRVGKMEKGDAVRIISQLRQHFGINLLEVAEYENER